MPQVEKFFLRGLCHLGSNPYPCRPVENSEFSTGPKSVSADFPTIPIAIGIGIHWLKPDLLIKSHLMSNYELMVIFTPVLSDEEFKGEQKRYAALVKDSGGSIVAENAWGLKSLAYPIRKKTTGLYWVLEYAAPSEFNEKLKVQLLRDENVLRHLATKLDKYAVEYNQKKRSGVPTGTEKVVEA